MKYTTYIIIGLLSISAIQCRKTKNPVEEQKLKNIGTITGILNGQPWKADITEAKLHTENNKNFYIFGKIVGAGTILQSLSFSEIALNNHRQKLYSPIPWIVFEKTARSRGKDTATAAYSLKNYDEGENIYLPVENEDNYIQLEGYDVSSPVIRGRFEITLYRSYKDSKPQTQGLPDTLHFTDGHFDLELFK